MGVSNEAQEAYNVIKIEMINKKPDNNMLSGFFCRAGDEVRTRDIQLGRLTLYQLSYSRNYNDINNFPSANIRAFVIIFQIF